MFKKFLSVLLAVMMVVSVMAVAVVTTSAADLDPAKLYFDPSGTGWDMSAKNDKVGFYIYGGDLESVIGFGGSKLAVTKDADGLYGFDPTSVKYELHDGVQYKVNFFHMRGKNTVAGEQTYDLFFDTTCFGHTAYSDGSTIENPVDSTKSTMAAYWRDMDATKVGPVLQLSSIGNVCGTCPAQGETVEDIFVDFISVVKEDYGTTGFENARKNVVNVGTKSEQQLIDDIGTGLGLTKDFIKDAFAENEIETVWSYDDSTLPGGEIPHEHTPGEPVRENIKDATCTAEGSYDEVIYCTECGEELSRETKTIEKLAHTPGEQKFENEIPATCTVDGSYDVVVYCAVCGEELSREKEVDPAEGHTTTEPVRENVTPATCTAEGSYDEVIYCGNCGEVISRGTYSIPKLDHTPGEPVRENVVPVTCETDGSYDKVVYCTVCGEELSRTHYDVWCPGHNIVFAPTIPATATEDGRKAHYECTSCGKLYADAAGDIEVSAEDLVIKAEHKRGDANSDGEVDINDATTIQRVLVELSVPAYDEIAADADQDGVVDMVDVTLIQRIDIGLTTFEKWDAAHAK